MGAKFRLLGTERGILFIEDLDRDISVTNDAENVWRRVMSGTQPGTYPRLVYKDTAGEWWEIIPTFVDRNNSGQHSELQMEFKRWHGHVWDELSNGTSNVL